MCGIFALLNNGKEDRFSNGIINDAFEKGKNRGPEYSICEQKFEQQLMGFHRLAINGVGDESSHQPFTINNVSLICNGEIYNFKELYDNTDIKPLTRSDCEVIIHMYILYGIEYTLNLLDGVFAFVLFDNRDVLNPIIHVARDPFGVRPLYMMTPTIFEKQFGFASEIKVLSSLIVNNNCTNYKYFTINHFNPGSYMSFNTDRRGLFNIMTPITRYTTFNFIKSTISTIEHVEYNTWKLLNAAVKKRVCGTTERPIACLLSGGLDSSLITALVNKYYTGKLETYSIGMSGSEDLKYAECVAKHLGTKHTSIVLTEDDFFNAIPEVITAIESYDTTTVRASVGNYLIGKYIAKHSNAKVIFNGDGSDELTGGYLYFHEAPNDFEFDKECKRLLTDIHAFDVLRSDKCISSHGLEPRTPFLDREFVNYYLNIPSSIRNNKNRYGKKNTGKKYIEKYFLRSLISTYDYFLLPEKVLWRRKEAFSDGVSGTNKSWFEVIKDKLNAMNIEQSTNTLLTKEQSYYKSIFDHAYPYCSQVVPYYWMPRFVEATDASARTLKIYNDNSTDENSTHENSTCKNVEEPIVNKVIFSCQ
jgi:asparagine synthase (glutamine-hydrolysing)